MTKFSSALSFCIMLLVLVACENPYNPDADGNGQSGQDGSGFNVCFSVSGIESPDFVMGSPRTRSVRPVSEVCSRISLAVFNDNGKVKSVLQEVGDKDFGTVSVALERGDYELVVIAHNGEGAATVTSPQEIKFKDNKVTDTFYCYRTITVDGDGTFELMLERAVAMVRIVVSDNVPQSVNQFRFYYTGGSSTFDARNGVGCVNSRQTELRPVPAAAHEASSAYEIYTFPHAVSGGELKITVTALDAAGEQVEEHVFEQVPVGIGQITQYTGNFFGASADGGRSDFPVMVNDEWTLYEQTY